MIRYIKNEQHYNLLLEQIAKVKHTLWIGTADLKDLYVKKGNKAVPFCKMKGDCNNKNIPFSHYQLIHLQINTLVITLLVTIVTNKVITNIYYTHVILKESSLSPL